MFEINLAKDRKLKTEKPSRKPLKLPLPRKGFLYGFVISLLVIGGLYNYSQQIYDYFSQPVAIPAPIAVAEPEPVEEPPTPEPPPEPEPVSQETVGKVMELHAGYASNKRQIDTYNTIAASLKSGSDFNLISVQGRVFLTEVVAGSRTRLKRSEQSVQSRFTELTIQSYDISPAPGSVLVNGGIWGYYPEETVAGEKNVVDEFLSGHDFLETVQSISRKHKFQMLAPQSRTPDADLRIALHFHGPKAGTQAFLEALDARHLNCRIAKISSLLAEKKAVGDAEVYLLIEAEIVHQ